MNIFKRKKERPIIILGTGPGAELCPFDKETWVVAKIIMTPKPQWRVDKMFSLDDVDTMLSVKKEHTKEEFLEKLENFEKEVLGFGEASRKNLKDYEEKEETGKLVDITKNTAIQSEGLHAELMELTRIREGLHFQGKFTREQFIQRINSKKALFITQQKHPEIPLSQAFPLKEAMWEFGTPYFTNTICYMICLAIMEKVTSIDIWGVVQGGYQEYLRERKGVEYWLGLASGRGIKININAITQLFTNDQNGKLYGYKKTIEQLQKEGVL